MGLRARESLAGVLSGIRQTHWELCIGIESTTLRLRALVSWHGDGPVNALHWSGRDDAALLNKPSEHLRK